MSISDARASSLAYFECFWATAYPSNGRDGSFLGHSLQIIDGESQILLHYLLYPSPQPTLPALGTCLYMMNKDLVAYLHFAVFPVFTSLDTTADLPWTQTIHFCWLAVALGSLFAKRITLGHVSFFFLFFFLSVIGFYFSFLYFLLIFTMSSTGSHTETGSSLQSYLLILLFWFFIFISRVPINRE